MGIFNKLNYIRLVPKNEKDLPLLGKLVDQYIPRIDTWNYQRMKQSVDESLGGMITALNSVKYFVLFIALAAIFNTFYMAIKNREHILATLKACGATDGQILTLIAEEAGLISILGSIIGTFIAGLIIAAIIGSFKWNEKQHLQN